MQPAFNGGQAVGFGLRPVFLHGASFLTNNFCNRVIFSYKCLLMQKHLPMKRYGCFAFILFLGATQLVAQPPKSSLLWEINGNGLEKPSYLFGTFHLMCRGDFSVTPILESKIKASQQFYGELDLDQPDLQMSMMTKMIMQGKTLESLLGEADYAKVSTRFQAITGMPMAMMNKFKPFLCLSLLTVKSTPCDETIQPETEFMTAAKANNLTIHGLETIDDQLNALDKEPLDSQILELKKIILNFDSVKNVMSELMAVYKKRDVDSLYSYMMNTGATEDFATELISRRNEKWIPLMQKAFTEKPTFFAVGAGHLGGPEGLISLLRKKGYRLTPVKF
jgi:uncharacterized protein YbaP (TraB family)